MPARDVVAYLCCAKKPTLSQTNPNPNSQSVCQRRYFQGNIKEFPMMTKTNQCVGEPRIFDIKLEIVEDFQSNSNRIVLCELFFPFD